MTSLKQKMVCMSAVAALLVMVCGCTPMLRSGIKIAHPAIENIEVALFQQKNLDIVEKGLPGQILLLEGLMGTAPDDTLLLTMAIKAYTGLGMLIEDQYPEKATALYTRGTECGMRLLKQHRGFRKAIEDGKSIGEATKQIKSKKYVPALLWTASCMGANVLLNAGDPMIAIDLAPVNTMANHVAALDSNYFYGFAHMFVGTVNSMLPATFGGDKQKAREAFDTINKMNKGKFLLPKVFYAKFYLTDDKEVAKELCAIINTPEGQMPEIELLNQIAKAKARHCLKQKGGSCD
jgi:hypothetical protein